MNKVTTLKTAMTTVMSLLTALFGVLAIPIMLMAMCNVIDYITGLFAVPHRNQSIDSYKGIQGIKKKISMWLLIVVGAIIDQLILYASNTIGFSVPFTFLISIVVTVWLICNELISILENLVDIGIKVPNFLTPIVKNLKSQVEKITDNNESEELKNE